MKCRFNINKMDIQHLGIGLSRKKLSATSAGQSRFKRGDALNSGRTNAADHHRTNSKVTNELSEKPQLMSSNEDSQTKVNLELYINSPTAGTATGYINQQDGGLPRSQLDTSKVETHLIAQSVLSAPQAG